MSSRLLTIRIISMFIVISLIAADISGTSAALALPDEHRAVNAASSFANVKLKKPSSTGALVDVPSHTVWGGATGKAVKAKRDIAIDTRAAKVPKSARAVVVQVDVLDAKKAGSMQIRAKGTKANGVEAIAFRKGNSSSTVLVRRSAGKITIRSSTKAKVRVTVVGYVAGNDAQPGPGGTKSVASYRLVDSTKKIGAPVLKKGKTGTASVLGLGGIPTENVRGVWLQVQSQGKGSGQVTIRGASGNSVAGLHTYSKEWTTSLVFAPVDQDGQVRYVVSGKGLKALRLVVVGWVSETRISDSTATISGGIVPVPSRSLNLAEEKIGKKKTTQKISTWSSKVSGKGVPTGVKKVVLRLGIVNGKTGGHIRFAQSVNEVASKKAIGAPIAARTRATITIVAPVSKSGRVYVAVPKGAKVNTLHLNGYVSGKAAKKSDKSAPVVKITSPKPNASVDLAKTPVVTLTGTVSDPQSGVGRVLVYGDKKLLGAAVIDTTSSPAKWSLRTSIPAGKATFSVIAVNGAGRTKSSVRTVRGKKPAASKTVISDAAVVMTKAEEAKVTNVTENKIAISSPSTRYAVGDVLVSGPSKAAPEGLMRKVKSVRVVNNRTELITESAVLTDVFNQLRVKIVDAGPNGAASGSTPIYPVSNTQLLGQKGETNLRAAEGGSDRWSINPSVSWNLSPQKNISLKAAMGVKASAQLTFDLDIDPDWSWGIPKPEVKLFEFIVSTEAQVSTSFNASGSMNLWKAERDLAQVRLGAIVIMAGPVPIVLTTSVAPKMKFSAKASGSVSYQSTTTNLMEMGARYEDGKWESISSRSSDDSPENRPRSAIKVEFMARGAVELAYEVKLYDLVGPYASAEASATAAVSANSKKADFELKAGLDLKIGAKASFLSEDIAKYEISLFGFSISLLKMSWSLEAEETPPDTGEKDPVPTPNPTIDPSPEPEPEPSPEPTATPTEPGNMDGDDETEPPGSPGTVWGWSRYYSNGQTLGGPTDDGFAPKQVQGLSNVIDVSGRFSFGLALRADGTVWGWGSDLYLDLGHDAGDDTSVPVQVPTLENITAIASGTGGSAYALDADGTVWAWGRNDFGQLGIGTTASALVPVPVPGLSDVVAITAGNVSAYALKSDGTVWAWGRNFYGELGDGTTEHMSTPVQVLELNEVTAIAATGGSSAYALKSDGTVWAWGRGYGGSLGNGMTMHQSVPVQVLVPLDITAISASGDAGIALRSDGTVWGWGGQYDVQPNATIIPEEIVPVQISGLSNVVAITGGDLWSFAIRSDKTVWIWEYGAHSPLTDGSQTPRQLPELTGAKVIAGRSSDGYVLF
jgi:alpha-tubulin suppressor-like RCC1 family protein